jgi:hypothetical protein
MVEVEVDRAPGIIPCKIKRIGRTGLWRRRAVPVAKAW